MKRYASVIMAVVLAMLLMSATQAYAEHQNKHYHLFYNSQGYRDGEIVVTTGPYDDDDESITSKSVEYTYWIVDSCGDLHSLYVYYSFTMLWFIDVWIEMYWWFIGWDAVDDFFDEHTGECTSS